jgi:hypothetical protein
MSRSLLSVGLVLIVIFATAAIAQQQGNPFILRKNTTSKPPITGSSTDGAPRSSTTRKPPITGSSIEGGPRSETTHIDPVAQLELAVQRLEKENQALKAQIDKMKVDADKLRKDCDRNTESILTLNRGGYGEAMTMYATRKEIINGSCPDSAKFRVWLPKNAGWEKPDEMTIPNPIPKF